MQATRRAVGWVHIIASSPCFKGNGGREAIHTTVARRASVRFTSSLIYECIRETSQMDTPFRQRKLAAFTLIHRPWGRCTRLARGNGVRPTAEGRKARQKKARKRQLVKTDGVAFGGRRHKTAVAAFGRSEQAYTKTALLVDTIQWRLEVVDTKQWLLLGGQSKRIQTNGGFVFAATRVHTIRARVQWPMHASETAVQFVCFAATNIHTVPYVRA